MSLISNDSVVILFIYLSNSLMIINYLLM